MEVQVFSYDGCPKMCKYLFDYWPDNDRSC